MLTLEEEVDAILAQCEGIDLRDVVLYVASGVRDPVRIREYIAAGIGPDLAGRMELEK